MTVRGLIAAAGFGALAVAFAAKEPVKVVGSSGHAWVPKSERVLVRPAARMPAEHVPGFLFLEAEEFEDFGGWRLDTQYTHLMGSGYLIASGVGSPVAAAETGVEVPRQGVWRVWARTKDWLPKFSPGAFRLTVDGREGYRLGVSQRVGWHWELAGEFTLAPGRVRVRLEDLTGAFARCDALVFTTDPGYRPPEEAEALQAERCRLQGEKYELRERGEFDVVVVGAGPAGVPAAIAAARHGAKVALVGDRPVPGGNASDEIGVLMCGASYDKHAARETGIVEEIMNYLARHPGPGNSGAYLHFLEAEPNIAFFPCERVLKTEGGKDRIDAVVSRSTMDGKRSRFRGRLFIDATGDGWIGYFAGAEYRLGREDRREFNEEHAPLWPDTLTMSGLIQEPSVGVTFGVEKRDRPVKFEIPKWADILPRGFSRPYYGVRGMWWNEHPGWIDDMDDGEAARDLMLRYAIAYFDYLKNGPDERARKDAENYELVELPIFNGRRESRRLVGDYVLNENDCLKGRVFPDAIAYGGWPIDVHDFLGMSAVYSDGHRGDCITLPFYTIPYRSIYSKNVSNLFMAGRDLSASHVALGSARVQCTCSLVGQAAGTAAAMCAAKGVTPRKLGETAIRELQLKLQRDDCHLPGIGTADPEDLAMKAKVTASSCAERTRRYSLNAGTEKAGFLEYANVRPENVIDGIGRPVGLDSHAWVSAPGAKLPQWIRLDFPETVEAREVRIAFDSDLEFHCWMRRLGGELARSYLVETSEDGEAWLPLVDERDNGFRFRVHRFAPRKIRALRLTVRGTWGLDEANVFSIRIL